MEYEKRVIKLLVAPKDEPVFSEHAVTITIDDEAAGEYIALESLSEDKIVCLQDDNWPLIKEAIEELLENIKQHESNGTTDI